MAKHYIMIAEFDLLNSFGQVYCVCVMMMDLDLDLDLDFIVHSFHNSRDIN